jgi:hypothetical protein
MVHPNATARSTVLVAARNAGAKCEFRRCLQDFSKSRIAAGNATWCRDSGVPSKSTEGIGFTLDGKQLWRRSLISYGQSSSFSVKSSLCIIAPLPLLYGRLSVELHDFSASFSALPGIQKRAIFVMHSSQHFVTFWIPASRE